MHNHTMKSGIQSVNVCFILILNVSVVNNLTLYKSYDSQKSQSFFLS